MRPASNNNLEVIEDILETLSGSQVTAAVNAAEVERSVCVYVCACACVLWFVVCCAWPSVPVLLSV